MDAHLGRHIYQRCIEDFLHDKCVLIATHQLQFIPASTNILLLDNGESLAYGAFDSLMAQNKRFAEFFNLTKYSNAANVDQATLFENAHKLANEKDAIKLEDCKAKSTIPNSIAGHLQQKKLNTEVNCYSRVDSYQGIISQYWNYLKQGSTGFGSIHLVILTSILTQATLYFCDHWLTLWYILNYIICHLICIYFFF